MRMDYPNGIHKLLLPLIQAHVESTFDRCAFAQGCAKICRCAPLSHRIQDTMCFVWFPISCMSNANRQSQHFLTQQPAEVNRRLCFSSGEAHGELLKEFGQSVDVAFSAHRYYSTHDHGIRTYFPKRANTQKEVVLVVELTTIVSIMQLCNAAHYTTCVTYFEKLKSCVEKLELILLYST